MAVADVPVAVLSIVGILANFDRLQALGAGVGCPTLSGVCSGALIASVPDQVSGFDGHGSFRFDEISIGHGGRALRPSLCHFRDRPSGHSSRWNRSRGHPMPHRHP